MQINQYDFVNGEDILKQFMYKLQAIFRLVDKNALI